MEKESQIQKAAQAGPAVPVKPAPVKLTVKDLENAEKMAAQEIKSRSSSIVQIDKQMRDITRKYYDAMRGRRATPELKAECAQRYQMLQRERASAQRGIAEAQTRLTKARMDLALMRQNLPLASKPGLPAQPSQEGISFFEDFRGPSVVEFKDGRVVQAVAVMRIYEGISILSDDGSVANFKTSEVVEIRDLPQKPPEPLPEPARQKKKK
jgi:hypothetical protein